jgi:hypothetical protein
MMSYKETLQADEERASYIGKVSFVKFIEKHSQSPHTHRSRYLIAY